MNTNELWNREFAGFFWGEGNFMIDMYHRKMKSKRKLADGTIKDYGFRMQWNIRLRARVIQREDDRAILEQIQEKLGGHIYTHKSRKMVSGGNGKTYKNNTQLVWQAQDRRQVEKVLDILDKSEFQVTKRAEIRVMRDALHILDSHVRGWTDKELDSLRALKQELSDLRSYSGF